MNKEEINYSDYVLDSSKDVMVPLKDYMEISKIINVTEERHTKRYASDVYSWYNRTTKAKLTPKNAAKMAKDKLQKEYFQQIDMELTQANVRTDRDELSMACLDMIGKMHGIIRYNMDNGNKVAKTDLQPNVPAPTPTTDGE